MAEASISFVLSFGFIIFAFILKVQAGCTFPLRFQGEWRPTECSSLLVSSDNSCHINIGQTTVSGLSNSGETDLQFECLMQNGNRFAMRSRETSLLSNPVRIYVCWEFSQQAGGDSIMVQQHTNRVSKWSEKRGIAFEVEYSPNILDCCDVQTSTPSLFWMDPVS